MKMIMKMKMTMIRRPTETLKLLLGEAICCLFWGIYVHLRTREMPSTGFLGSLNMLAAKKFSEALSPPCNHISSPSPQSEWQ